MNLVISVTQEDIDNGKKGSLSACPIGIAIRRHMKALYPHANVPVHVTLEHFYCGDSKWDIDEADVKFIGDFDNGLSVAPYETTLNNFSYEEDIEPCTKL